MGSSANEEMEQKTSLLVVLETYDTLGRTLSTMQLGSQFASHLKTSASRLREKCEQIISKNNCLKRISNLLFETSLGTMSQLRIELEINFGGKSVKVGVQKGVGLDCMVIPPIIPNESARSRDMRSRAIEHQLEDKEAAASRDNSMKNSNVGLRMNDSLFSTNESINFVVFCQPNGVPFEVNYYDQTWLRFFLEKNYHVLLWNYRGYGRSEGKPTLEVNFQ